MIYTPALLDGLRPDPPLTLSEFSDKTIVLPQKGSAEPGPYRTDRTPYLREIMDELSPSSSYKKVVIMKAAQVGLTQVGINWLGYQVVVSPGPALVVLPTVELAQRFSRQRLQATIDESPDLKARIAPSRERDSDNTILSKGYPGGIIMLTGSNSAAGLRSMPIRYLILDDVDAFVQDLEGEGDPISIAEKRTLTFHNRKVLIISTPTVKGYSRVELEFKGSDQRYYYVPCPLCGELQVLKWSGIKFTRDDQGKPIDVWYECSSCHGRIDEHHKTAMLAAGQWRKHNPDSKVAGFHISGLYSPAGWLSWLQIVEEFLEAKKDAALLKTWTNTVLGETWEDARETIDEMDLYRKRETYPAPVPAPCLVLTAFADVQADRLEVTVAGWAAGYHGYVVAHDTIYGAPEGMEVWKALDEYLAKPWRHEGGYELPIVSAFIDSGYLTQEVYSFTKPREPRRIFATKGTSGPSRPVVGRESMAPGTNVALYLIGVDQAKDAIFAKIKSGQLHFPDVLDEEYFKQITSETAVPIYKRGYLHRIYVKDPKRRNEALDCLVGAYAAVVNLRPDWPWLLEHRPKPKDQAPEEPKPAQPTTHQRRPLQPARSGNWVTGGIKW